MKQLLAKFRLSSWLASSSLDTRYALIEACLIGLFSALAAVLLKQGIGWLGGWRIKTIHLAGAKIVLPLAGLVFGILAGGIIELLAPSAAGGGIPQVKAALAKYPIVLNLRTALVKTIATIFIVGAGFTLGRRGPTVHIGAALGAQVSRWIPNSPTNRRQMIAAGAAAGLAAGFNTPIAGVLFVVEELMRDISGLTLETAIAASFTGAVVSRILGSSDINVPLSVIDSARRGSFAIPEIPFYVFLGILAGVLGGIFNRFIIRGMEFSRSLPLPVPLRIGLAGLISGSIVAWLPPFFQDNAGLRELLIAGQFTWQIIAIIFITQFCLTILAYSAGAPGGLFAPALVLGSALGYLVGLAEVMLIHSESPYTFAFAGMAAFFTAVVRVPVTAIIIIFEMTADFNLVLPLMISSAVAYIVAESVSQGSLYEHLLEASGIEINEQHPQNDFMSELTANDVMEAKVETLASNLNLLEVIKAMSRSHHRGFPVVDDGKLVGIITQSDIPQDSKQNSNLVLLKDIMTPQPISVCPDTSLADVLYLLNRYQLSRLPVTEGTKLLGIITRSDIIKAEANQLSYHREHKMRAKPSYVVYQTRSPATGKGRLLLPLGNPDNLAALLKIAKAIASYHQYEIEFLRVTSVPSHIHPAQAKVENQQIRQLMEKLEQWGKKSAIPVHTQIRVATDIGAAILEAINKEHIDLILMGWKGSSGIESIFSNVVDYLIKEAPCNLMLVKLGKSNYAFPQELDLKQKWLIPTTGGDRVNKLLDTLKALSNFSLIPAKIQLCQVYPPDQPHLSHADFQHAANLLQEHLHCPIVPLRISAYSISETIINLSKNKKYSLIILGASNEGLLQNVVKGNIPEAISKHVNTTVIIVRSFNS